MTRSEFEAEIRREGYELGETELKPHVHRQLHTHDYDTRLFVVDGTLTLDYGHERVTYRPGDAWNVPAGTVHAEHTEADGVRLVLGRRSPARKDS